MYAAFNVGEPYSVWSSMGRTEALLEAKKVNLNRPEQRDHF